MNGSRFVPSAELSWDDFRIVKAIADARTLSKAAAALKINHSTVFRRLSQIEQRLDVRLFTRSRGNYAPTPRGEQTVQLAERIQADVAAFERQIHGKDGTARSYTYGVTPLDVIVPMGGLAFLRAMIAGKLPQAPICATLGFHLTEAEEGRAVFEGLPEFRHYNPISSVHGGFHATLLDSALGCAVFSTLAKGEAWTTLELKINFVRPINQDTGLVRAEGRIIHRGRTVATSEGDVRDKAGKLYAHASTTCMVFPAKG
jgi:uncharacterized protein (TIGR00369 family)